MPKPFDTRKLKRADPFYLTPTWRALRAAIVKRDGYRCVVCGCDVSAIGAARVDHIKTRKTHPELALDATNLRTLCTLHDAHGHREKFTGAAERDERFVLRGVDADGWPPER